ncbi:hypothetical protein ACGF0D_25725 [Kitasatospora sp. NPDC048298]|uniref:hypothetical protein n=1 Tax=Kitasatospora sp. NPDC048298 TaxID=3364049 RepID=UPI003716B19B
MVTHRNEFRIRTTVMVAVRGDQGVVAWAACPELPVILAESTIRTCLDLVRTLETQGRVVAGLLSKVPYEQFRVLARDVTTAGLAGSVEWVRNRYTGAWEQWGDEPWTGCEYGCHQPAPTMWEAA